VQWKPTLLQCTKKKGGELSKRGPNLRSASQPTPLPFPLVYTLSHCTRSPVSRHEHSYPLPPRVVGTRPVAHSLQRPAVACIVEFEPSGENKRG
jgi:hypothetical protein